MSNTMKLFIRLALVLVVLAISTKAEAPSKKITKARLESCPACKLNRLTEVRAFAYEDLPKYENAEFKKIQGASPVLLFLNDDDEIVERFPLDALNRKECNALLEERGFTLKTNKEL